MTRPTNTLGFFLKSNAIFGMLSAVAAMAAFLLLPVYTRLFTVEEMAFLGILQSCRNILIAIVSFGIPTMIVRFMHDCANDDERRITVRTGFWTALVFSIVVVVFGIVFGPGVLELMSYELVDPLAFALMLCCVGAYNAISCGPLALLRSRLEFKKFAIGNASVAVLQIGLILGALFVTDLGVAGVYGGQFAAILIVLSVLIFDQRRWYGPGYRPALARRMVGTGTPVILNELSMIYIIWGIVFAAQYFLTARDAATMTIVSYVALIFQTVISRPLAITWWPTHMANRQDVEAATALKARAVLLVLTLGVGMTVGMAWLGPLMMAPVFGQDYANAAAPATLIGVAMTMAGLQVFFTGDLIIRGQTLRIAGICLLQMLVASLAWMVLSGPWGNVGIATGTVLSAASGLALALALGEAPVFRRVQSFYCVFAVLNGAVAISASWVLGGGWPWWGSAVACLLQFAVTGLVLKHFRPI